MKRRDFLSKSVIATTAVAGSAVLASSANAAAKKPVKTQCKVTVIKKEHYKDLYKQYRGKTGKPCPVFEVGQEFLISKEWKCPEGFCNSAWADVRTYIHSAKAGQSKPTAGCCTSGCRPVVFRFETVEVKKES